MKPLFAIVVPTCFLFLTGCLNPMQQYKMGMDTCGISVTKPLLGKKIDEVDLDELLGEKFLHRVVDPRLPDHIYTSDLRVRRQNLILDNEGVFLESRCG